MGLDVTLDSPRFSAIIVTAGGHVYQVVSIESIQFSKTDSGDAGDFTITLPLGLNIGLGVDLSPMDLIAVYATRSTTWVNGRKALGTTEIINPLSPLSGIQGLTYGAENAATTASLQNEGLMFLGMIDKVGEQVVYSDQPVATMTITGRDLTKIFLDNDTFVNYTLPGSDPGNNAIGNLESLVLSVFNSGTQLLLSALDIFCAKDPLAIQNALSSNDAASSDSLIQQIAQYGYPWRKFVDVTQLDPSFQILSPDAHPPYQVQSGSVWASVLDLRNFPVGQLFVNEIGQLIFRDTLNAWASADVLSRIDPSEIRNIEFIQTDENMVTSQTILPGITVSGVSQLAALSETGQSRVPSVKGTIQRFGYRWNPFTSIFDSIESLQSQNIINRRFQLLWLMKNTFWTCQITVKGTTKHRVGKRLFLNAGGSNSATQFHNWYISQIEQQAQYGTDWTTTLLLRYSDGENPQGVVPT